MSKCLKEKVRCILYSSVIFNVILLLVLGGLIYYKNTRKDKDPVNSKGTLNSQVQLPGHSGVCILCDYLGKDITAKDTLFDRIETVKDGHRICCTTKPSFMPKLIGKMIMTEKERAEDTENYENLKKQLTWWRSRPGSIHMHLDLDKLKDKEFIWKTDEDSLGMSYRNGIDINTTSSSIVIPRKALYFVYVAITFDFGDITSIPIFYHNVTKSHPLLPRTIDTLLMSKYGGSTESERVYTSFLCGTFQMQGNFNIKTEVSSYDYVSKSKYASYFGMFRI